MRKALQFIQFFCLCSILAAQQVLNNDAIIKLVKSGISDDFIISTINGQPGSYDAGPDAIVALKSAGASDRVMTAIVQKVETGAPAVQPLTRPQESSAPLPLRIAATPPLIAPAQPVAHTTERPRVFITDSESWETSGSAGGSNGSFAAQMHGGARPQTAEIIKTFGERCSEVVVNNRQLIADYIIVLDHEGGKGYLRHRNKVAVFEHGSGDVVMSKSTLSLGGSVEEACNGIIAHWAAHSREILAGRDAPVPLKRTNSDPTPVVAIAMPTAAERATVSIESAPSGAEIEVHGAFVGNTPSTVSLSSGSHRVAVTKKAFIGWARTLNVTGGTIHLNADLEQEQPKQ